MIGVMYFRMLLGCKIMATFSYIVARAAQPFLQLSHSMQLVGAGSLPIVCRIPCKCLPD